MAGGSTSKLNHGTYSEKKQGAPGAKVTRGKSGPSVPDKKMKADYSVKGGGMPGAKVNRGSS